MEHNSMVLVWGSLLCVVFASENKPNNWEDLDREQIFRAIRVFYLRYRNFGRAVAALPKTVKGVMDDDPGVLGGDEDATEERARWDFLKARSAEERRQIESVIWKIEDHPLNRNGGRGLGGTNLTHLVDLSAAQPPTLEQLEVARDAFFELFPAEEGPATDKKKRVASVLLYYGPFWNRVGPWYYENYELGEWPRTIRGRGSEEKRGVEGTIFRRFFDDFLRAGQALDTIADSKKAYERVDPQSEKDLRRALIWYSEAVGIRFLEKGMHVAKSYEERDLYFPEIPTLWNTKGDFKGERGNRKLGDLIETQLRQ